MLPIDVATEDSIKFIQANLPPDAHRLLEVGCGRGDLALALQNLGYEVIALDASPEAVQAARNLGVDARQVRWPDFEDTPFDAILFTHSLHHIGPLAEAVDRAKALLLPGGKVMVLDFDFEAFDLKTSEWIFGLAQTLKSTGLLSETGGILPAFLETGGGFSFWAQQRHGHDLHLMPAIKAELQRILSSVTETAANNSFRYFLPSLPQNDLGYAIAGSIFEAEKRLGEVGGIVLFGCRFVGEN